jgi:hypothetical protein
MRFYSTVARFVVPITAFALFAGTLMQTAGFSGGRF